jgi:hypothetical protein
LFGAWRSLVAHLTGGQGVAGSNPVAPTKTKSSACNMQGFSVSDTELMSENSFFLNLI